MLALTVLAREGGGARGGSLLVGKTTRGWCEAETEDSEAYGQLLLTWEATQL